MARDEPEGHFKNMLNEVLPMSRKVSRWEPFTRQTTGAVVGQGGGECEPRYQIPDSETPEKPESYVVKYSRLENPQDYVAKGNVLHELTHARVVEAYGDFVNYKAAPKRPVPERKLNVGAYCTNKEDRISALMNDDMNDQVMKDIASLKRATDGSRLPQGCREELHLKLDYAMQNPHTEYQTVLNQTSLWLRDWEPKDTDLIERFDLSVESANRSREVAENGGTHPGYPYQEPAAPAPLPGAIADRSKCSCCIVS
jgi:hypothetical protein